MLIILYTALFQITFVGAQEISKLYEEISNYKKEFDIEGQDARCDSVFKLIPGVSGRSIDVEKSYRNMKTNKTFDITKLVVDGQNVKTIDDLDCGPIYKGNEQKKQVSLIINVAWGEEYLPSMLETLDKYGIKANFFIEGRWASQNLDLVFDIHTRGHIIGNHSYTHANFALINKEKAFKEIMDTNFILESITNYKIKYFGPPSGAFKEETLGVVSSLQMKQLQWTVDTIDWQKPSVNVIKERVLSKYTNGSIVLMHPTENTALALDDIVKSITNNNFEINHLDKFLY